MKKIKITKEQLAIIKKYWKKLKELESQFYMDVGVLETKLAKVSGIKDIEFFACDGAYVGVGNADRTLDLIQQEKLES